MSTDLMLDPSILMDPEVPDGELRGLIQERKNVGQVCLPASAQDRCGRVRRRCREHEPTRSVECRYRSTWKRLLATAEIVRSQADHWEVCPATCLRRGVPLLGDAIACVLGARFDASLSEQQDVAGDLGGMRPIPDDWAIDWLFFIDLDHGAAPPDANGPNDPIRRKPQRGIQDRYIIGQPTRLAAPVRGQQPLVARAAKPVARTGLRAAMRPGRRPPPR